MATWTVYGLTDPDSGCIRYVGCTKKSVLSRVRQHVWQSAKETNRKAAWIRELAIHNCIPGYVELQGDLAVDEWEAAEKAWVSKLKEGDRGLLNDTDGGRGANGWVPSESYRRNRSLVLTGRPRSEESRANQSRATKGKPHSPEHREKLAALLRVRNKSKESREKVSRALKGRIFTAEWMAKIAESKRKTREAA